MVEAIWTSFHLPSYGKLLVPRLPTQPDTVKMIRTLSLIMITRNRKAPAIKGQIFRTRRPEAAPESGAGTS